MKRVSDDDPPAGAQVILMFGYGAWMKSSQFPPPPRSVFITPRAVTRRAGSRASPAVAPLMAMVLNLRGRRGVMPPGAVYTATSCIAGRGP